MPEDIESIRTIRAQTLAQLVELRANVKPTYWVDGQRVHWEQYVAALEATVDWCDRKLAEYAPFELTTPATS